MLLVVRPRATPLSRLPGNRSYINMRGREGAGDTSCLWSENSHDSNDERVRSQQRPPRSSLGLSLSSQPSSIPAPLSWVEIHTQPLERTERYVRLQIMSSRQGLPPNQLRCLFFLLFYYETFKSQEISKTSFTLLSSIKV